MWPSMMRARRSRASLRKPDCAGSVGSSTPACGKATTLSWSMAILPETCCFVSSTPEAGAAASRRGLGRGLVPPPRVMTHGGAGLVRLRRRAVEERGDLVKARVEARDVVLGHRYAERAARVRDGELHAGAGHDGEHRRLLEPALLHAADRLPGVRAHRARLLPQVEKARPLVLAKGDRGAPHRRHAEHADALLVAEKGADQYLAAGAVVFGDGGELGRRGRRRGGRLRRHRTGGLGERRRAKQCERGNGG